LSIGLKRRVRLLYYILGGRDSKSGELVLSTYEIAVFGVASSSCRSLAVGSGKPADVD
jgi:hypothetical protein